MFLDIQMMTAPETTIKVDFLEINSDEAVIQTTIEVKNPNSFQLITRDFEVVIVSEAGTNIGKVSIEGGDVPSGENRSFTGVAHIRFEDERLDRIATRITSTLGVTFLGFITKTLPINVSVIASVDEVVKDLDAPVVQITADFSDLSDKGVNFTARFEGYNPNPFELSVHNMTVAIESDTGEPVGSMLVPGGMIPAKRSVVFNGTGMVLIEVLNAQTLIVNMSALAGAEIAGFNKSMAVSTTAQIILPDLEELLSSETPTDVVIWGDYKFTWNGVVLNVTLEFSNPNKVTFIARDVTCAIYRVDGDREQLIGSGVLEEGVIPAEKTTTLLQGEVEIPYSKFFTSDIGRGIPDWLLLSVRANLTIPGVDHSIWIGINGYQDLHPFK